MASKKEQAIRFALAAARIAEKSTDSRAIAQIAHAAEQILDETEPGTPPRAALHEPATVEPGSTASSGAADALAKVYPFNEGDTDAIVIRCADPRFRAACEQFVSDLGIGHPATIAVTGSIKSFGLQAYVPKEWHALKKQLELITTRHSHVERVVLITHEDCQSYQASAHLLGGLAKVLAQQHAHLLALAKYLRAKYLPDATFELYHAKLVPQEGGKGVQFERLTEV